MAETTPPLPTLVGNKQHSARDPGVPRVKFGYVMRDVVFSVAYAIAAYAATFFIVEYLLHNVLSRTSQTSSVVLGLLSTAGYMLIATWGRQPTPVRILRLFYDVIGFQFVFEAGRWFLMGGNVFLSTGKASVIFIAGNFVVAGIGGALSCIIAPHKKTKLPEDDLPEK